MTICETGVVTIIVMEYIHFRSNTEYITSTIKPLPFKLIWRLLCTLIIHILRELSEGLFHNKNIIIILKFYVHIPCLVTVIAHILSQAALSFFSPILQPFLIKEVSTTYYNINPICSVIAYYFNTIIVQSELRTYWLHIPVCISHIYDNVISDWTNFRLSGKPNYQIISPVAIYFSVVMRCNLW